MGLNIIDISSHQASINLASIFAQNPINGVIVKSTQGTTYVNPYCDGWIQWLVANYKPWGFYHYLSGTNAVNEAKYWVEQTLNYWGHGIPCADFEAEIVSRGGIKYLQTFLETAYNETKVKPFIYCSLSVVQSHKKEFQTLAAAGYPLWLAQYASATNPQYGFNPTPWQSGSYAPFDKITMHQYSSLGRLNGYSSNLDFDLFYGDINDWNKFAAKEDSEQIPMDNREKAIQLLYEAIALLK